MKPMGRVYPPIFLLLLLASNALAQTRELDVAVRLHNDGEFMSSIERLARIEPSSLTIDARIRYFRYLGANYVAVDDQAKAESAFRGWIKLQPDLLIDTDSYSPSIVRTFERARQVVPIVYDLALRDFYPYKESGEISFQLNRNAQVNLTISSGRGGTLWSVDGTSHAGANTFGWDGRSSAGEFVNSGTYRFLTHARSENESLMRTWEVRLNHVSPHGSTLLVERNKASSAWAWAGGGLLLGVLAGAAISGFEEDEEGSSQFKNETAVLIGMGVGTLLGGIVGLISDAARNSRIRAHNVTIRQQNDQIRESFHYKIEAVTPIQPE